jgi:hypothetical protein
MVCWLGLGDGGTRDYPIGYLWPPYSISKRPLHSYGRRQIRRIMELPSHGLSVICKGQNQSLAMHLRCVKVSVDNLNFFGTLSLVTVAPDLASREYEYPDIKCPGGKIGHKAAERPEQLCRDCSLGQKVNSWISLMHAATRSPTVNKSRISGFEARACYFHQIAAYCTSSSLLITAGAS